MALKYAGFGLKEMMRSVFMPLQVMQVQKYIQEITTSDVERGPAGVRAQALAKDGESLFSAIVTTVSQYLNKEKLFQYIYVHIK